jgi:hypothetical protein
MAARRSILKPSSVDEDSLSRTFEKARVYPTRTQSTPIIDRQRSVAETRSSGTELGLASENQIVNDNEPSTHNDSTSRARTKHILQPPSRSEMTRSSKSSSDQSSRFDSEEEDWTSKAKFFEDHKWDDLFIDELGPPASKKNKIDATDQCSGHLTFCDDESRPWAECDLPDCDAWAYKVSHPHRRKALSGSYSKQADAVESICSTRIGSPGELGPTQNEV